MTNPPPNWMDEASRLARLWTEQQQNFIKMVTGNQGAFASPAGAAAPSAGGIDASLRQAQDLWRTSIEKWMALAPQGLAQPGNVDDVLKALFDPGAMGASAGLGPARPRDRAPGRRPELRDAVDARPQGAEGAASCVREWARDLAAWQLLMQGAWSEAIQALPARGQRTGRRADHELARA